MANGERTFHLVSLVNNQTYNLTILTSGKADFKPDQFAKFKRHKIDIIETEISEVEHRNGYVDTIIFQNGSRVPFNSIYAALPSTQKSEIPVLLNCELTEHGYIKVDAFQKTFSGCLCLWR